MSSSQGMAYPVAGVLEYLHNALDAVDALVVVYDADETLVACNRRCREVFAEAANLFTPGHSLTEILHGYYRAGGKLVPPGMSEEAYVATSLERLRDMFKPKKYTPAGLEVWDPPGLPPGDEPADAERRARLLASLREADGYVLVPRA